MKRTPMKRSGRIRAPKRAELSQEAIEAENEWQAAREAVLRRDLYCCQARRFDLGSRATGRSHSPATRCTTPSGIR